MRYVGSLALFLSLICVNPVDAHEIDIGDILLTSDLSGQYIETENLLISLKGADDTLYDNPHYQVTVRSKETGAESSNDYPENGGGHYSLIAFNSDYYCDEKIIFITLRQGWPKLADILQYRFETHAFHRDSLQYLATAYGPYEDITPFERGTDFEFPKEMPQKFVVECTPRTEALGFQFSITDRAEYLP
jgi:hypothetical protein